MIFRNAGTLFFAKNVRRFFPQAYITCLLARGTDKVYILDRKDFDGGIVIALTKSHNVSQLCPLIFLRTRGFCIRSDSNPFA